MVKANHKITILAIAIAAFCGIVFASPVSAKSYSSCISSAQSKFKVNTDISPQVYDTIDEVSPDSYGVRWACNTAGPTGVTWITKGSGQSSNGDGTYTINVNTKISRTGTTRVGVTGAISANTSGYVYGTNVRICARKGSYCWSDIGISTSDGWSWSSGWGDYYLRATENVSENSWTNPHTSFININADTLLNKKDDSGNKVLEIDEHDGYGLAKLWIYRAFNGINPGWSYFYLVMDKADQVAHFTATSSVVSGDVDSNGRYTVKIKHTIKRTSGDSFSIGNDWSTNPGAHPKSSGTWTSTNPGDSSTVKTETLNGYINYNGSVTVCSSLNYYSEIHTNGNKTAATTTPACKPLTRGRPSSTGEIKVDVYGDGKPEAIGHTATRYVLSENGSGQYRIVYHDEAKRNDSVGDKVSFNWKTTNTNKTLTAEGTVNLDKSDSSGYVSSGGTIVSHHPEVNGVLKYGQTVTFCNNFEWHSTKHKYTDWYYDASSNSMKSRTVEENYTSINGSKNGGCVEIYRPEKRCAINSTLKYGIENGENLGRIGIRNFSNLTVGDYSWTPVNSSPTHQVSYDDPNIWAQPGDSIQFKYEACAGSFYTIEANPNISGLGTHYSTAGWIAKNAYGTDASSIGTRYYGNSTNGYLFKDEVNRYRNYSNYTNPVNASNANLAAITATTPKPYATWTTGYNGASKEPSGRFLSIGATNPIAEMSGNSATSIGVPAQKSPSVNTYDGDVANTYKVCKSNGTGCRLGQQDVGTSITQQFTWNHLVLRNSSVYGSVTTHSATGMVRVPYNYYLRPYVTNSDPNGVVYLGENKTMYPGIVVYPRTNTLVHGGTSYATITKETHINVRVYNSRTNRNLKETTKVVKRLNQNGDILTSADKDTSFLPEGQVDFEILDDGYNAVGDRVCVELKIWPIDSHETGNSSTVYGGVASSRNASDWTKQYALMEGYTTYDDGSPRHYATATSCSTIAKRPTMSVESSNAFSATVADGKTGFTTGLYAKRFTTGGKKYLFGSWSEYGVFGSINISDGRTFTSGAVLGYAENSGGTKRNAPRKNDDTQAVAKGSSSGKVCMFSTQTFVNLVDNECKSSSTVIGSDAAMGYRDNILERYSGIGEDSSSSHIKVTKKTADNRYDLNLTTDKIEDYRLEKGNSKSIVALYADGNAVLNGTPKFATNDNRTIVYIVKGTLTIYGNINDERSEVKSNLSDVTGVIIIAKKVWIAPDVNYINAAIVTRDESGAEINTCRNGAAYTLGTENSGTDLSSERCNKTLVFDGPVFTRKIILNRTAGASDGGYNAYGAGADSIKRAEIFNLNMANYLWSFDQMTHYSQAVTTYSRELPTRY